MKALVWGSNKKTYNKDVYVSEKENIITARSKFRDQRHSIAFFIQPF